MGLRIGRRASAPNDRMAVRAFSFWWVGLALLSFVGAAQTALWVAGLRDPLLYTGVTYLILGPFCAMVWGLFYYLAYLFSGRREVAWISVALYALAYVALVLLVAMSDPVGVEAATWDVRLAYARTPPPLVVLGALALLILPVIGGAIAYGSLFFRVKEPVQRYRIAVVSMALLVWLGGPLGAQLAGIGNDAAWMVVSRFVGLLAALSILLAYRPPERVLRRLMRRSSGGEPGNG